MRIAQVVTLISPDAAYGGPVRVALNQAKELIHRGHDVVILAGSSGYSSTLNEIEGVPVVLFPVHKVIPRAGFAGLSSWRLWLHLIGHAQDFDVIHVHMARDLVTLPAAALALLRNMPLALQCHGMIDPSGNVLAFPLDALFTRRILKASNRIFYLTPQERKDLEAVAGDGLPLFSLPNGVPLHDKVTPPRGQVAVLFLARMHLRKRPKMFVEAAKAILNEGHRATFALVGPDEGEVPGLDDRIGRWSKRLKWEGSLPPDEALNRMKSASLYVLPSINEPFPMSVLEAMSIGMPVVVTESCGVAPQIKAAEAGVVVDHSQEALTDAIRALVTDTARRETMGQNAHELARSDFSIEAIGTRLEGHYERMVLEDSKARRGAAACPAPSEEMGR